MVNTRSLLLLSSSKVYGNTTYFEYCVDDVKHFFDRHDVRKVLFIPYAGFDYDKYYQDMKRPFEKIGLQLESIHKLVKSKSPAQVVHDAHGIFVGGGNTFKLLNTLYEESLLEPIRKCVLDEGIPYMGSSAGTNVATCSICTTNDMPIVYPPSFSALHLVPFNINPHYLEPDSGSEHMGETRDDRINEFHKLPKMPPVLGLREGCILSVEQDTATLMGVNGAKLFVSGKTAINYNVGDDLSFLIESRNK